MANLQIQAKQKKSPDGVLISMVNLVGTLDESTVVKFEEMMMMLLGRGLKNVILNCKDLEYINSSGMGLLVNMADRFNEKGGGIKLLTVPPKMAALFEMLGLHDIFPSYNMEEEAVVAYASAQKPASRPIPPPLQNAAMRQAPPSNPEPAEAMLVPDEVEENALHAPQGFLSPDIRLSNNDQNGLSSSPLKTSAQNAQGHEGLQRGIIQLLQSRFGDVPKEIQCKIYETESKKSLETLLNTSALASTILEFTQEMFRSISNHGGDKKTISIEIKIHY